MTKTVLVSDIHGNGRALEKVMAQEGTDARYIFLGDLVGLCGYPALVVNLAEIHGDFVLAGNHERAIFHEGVGSVVNEELSDFEYQHTMDALTDEDVEWVKDLPYLDVTVLDGARVCMAHAFPWTGQASGAEPGNAGVRKSELPEIASIVADDYDFVLLGHTHVQYEEDCSRWGHEVHVVNPGSLGYHHEYATVDFESGKVELKCVEDTHEEVSENLHEILPDDAPNVDEWL